MSDLIKETDLTRRRGSRGPYAYKVTDAEYFERLKARCKADERGCWIWQGCVGTKGYGQASYRNKPWAAHRLAYRLTKGDIPPRMQVMHSCDVPACCNPDHLSLGTNGDNHADKTAKGRHHSTIVTHCPRGHEYSKENTYVIKKPDGRTARDCRICQRARMRIDAGWPEAEAYSMPPVSPGQRPFNAPFKRARTSA